MSNSAFNKTEWLFFVGINIFLVYCIRRYTESFRFILIYLIIASYVPQGGKNTPLFEQFAATGMLSYADEEEEVVKTVLPVKAATEKVVVGPEDETELEDDTNVKKLRFSECLFLIWVISGPLLGFCNGWGVGGGGKGHYLGCWKQEPWNGLWGYPPLENFQIWRLWNAIFSTCHEICFQKIDFKQIHPQA